MPKCNAWFLVGTWRGSDNFEPDFLLLGKTLGAGYIPVSAVLLNNKIEKVIKNHSGRIGYSTTHQGHSLGVAAALEVQKIITKNNLSKHAFKIGNYFIDNLTEKLWSNHLVKSIHGRGLRFSVEYNSNDNIKFSSMLLDRLKYKYNILLDIKWHRAGFRPSFLVDYKTADFVIDCFVKEFNNLSTKYRPKEHTWNFD